MICDEPRPDATAAARRYCYRSMLLLILDATTTTMMMNHDSLLVVALLRLTIVKQLAFPVIHRILVMLYCRRIEEGVKFTVWFTGRRRWWELVRVFENRRRRWWEFVRNFVNRRRRWRELVRNFVERERKFVVNQGIYRIWSLSFDDFHVVFIHLLSFYLQLFCSFALCFDSFAVCTSFWLVCRAVDSSVPCALASDPFIHATSFNKVDHVALDFPLFLFSF